jgi:hypothetical protein
MLMLGKPPLVRIACGVVQSSLRLKYVSCAAWVTSSENVVELSEEGGWVDTESSE